MTAPAGRSLLRHPDFLKLWTGRDGQRLRDPGHAPRPADRRGHDPQRHAVRVRACSATIEFLPFIFLSLPAGVWVDRLRRRPILIVGDLGRAISLISIPIAYHAGVLTIWQLYVVGFVERLPDRLLRRRLPELPAVDRRARPARRGQLEARDHPVRVADRRARHRRRPHRPPEGAVRDRARRAELRRLGDLRLLDPAARAADRAPRRGQPGPRPSMRDEIADGPPLRHRPSLAAADRRDDGDVELLRQRRRARSSSCSSSGSATSPPSCIGFAFSIGSLGVLIAALATEPADLGRGRRADARPDVDRLQPVDPADRGGARRPAVRGRRRSPGSSAGFCGVAWNINQVSLRQAITPLRMQGKMNATMRFIVWGTIPLGAISRRLPRRRSSASTTRSGSPRSARSSAFLPGRSVAGPPHRRDAGAGGRWADAGATPDARG